MLLDFTEHYLSSAYASWCPALRWLFDREFKAESSTNRVDLQSWNRVLLIVSLIVVSYLRVNVLLLTATNGDASLRQSNVSLRVRENVA